MENFYSALIKKNGEFIHNPFSTSYDDLKYKYLSEKEIENNEYIRIKYCPQNKNVLYDINSYYFTIQETSIPDWFTSKLRNKCIDELKKIISSMIVNSYKPLLLNEGAILIKNSFVNEIKHSIVFGMYDDAKIKTLDNNSEIYYMTNNSKIINAKDGVKIHEMYENSTIVTMYDTSRVLNMYDNSIIKIMRNNSRIVSLKGGANINEMYDKTKANRLKHTSRVNEMHENSIIEELWDWSVVDIMFDNAKINKMNHESKVLEMYGNSTVDSMYGNSIVERLYENSLVKKLNDKAQVLMKNLN